MCNCTKSLKEAVADPTWQWHFLYMGIVNDAPRHGMCVCSRVANIAVCVANNNNKQAVLKKLESLHLSSTNGLKQNKNILFDLKKDTVPIDNNQLISL